MRTLTAVIVAICLSAPHCRAQVSVDPAQFPTIRNFLEHDARDKPFGCETRPVRPALTFTFHFQSGWMINIPTRNIRREKHRFVVVARIIPEHEGIRPMYLLQQSEVPETPARRNEAVNVYGAFLMGPGSYTVDVAAFDDVHSVCRNSWRVQAALTRSEQTIVPALGPWELQALEPGIWSRFAATRKTDRPRSGRLTVLLNAAPFRRWAVGVNGSEFGMMFSSVAALLRFTDFERIRMLAYNLDQQEIIYREDDFRPESIRGLARAIRRLNLATVPIDVVNHPDGYLDVLSSLIAAESARPDPSSVLLFLGPTVPYERGWKGVPKIEMPIVCANFRPIWTVPNWGDPRMQGMRSAEWPDLIERITKQNGGKVFRIHSPREFARALAHLSRHNARKP
jgi:hypothetical protein